MGYNWRLDCTWDYIELNARTLSEAEDPDHEWYQTACHEVGHVAGLGHRDGAGTTCMDSYTASISLDQHDIDAIANTYPR